MVSGKDIQLTIERLMGEGWDDSADIVSEMEGIIKAQIRKENHDAKRIEKLEAALVRKAIENFEECDGNCVDVDRPCPDRDHFDECKGCSLEKTAREQLTKEGLL